MDQAKIMRSSSQHQIAHQPSFWQGKVQYRCAIKTFVCVFLFLIFNVFKIFPTFFMNEKTLANQCSYNNMQLKEMGFFGV